MWHCTLSCLHILLTHNGQYVALCSRLLIHILFILLFLYCAIQACIRCKRLTNTLLHYITTAVTLVTRRKQGLTLRSNSWSCGAPQLQTACWCSAVAEVLLPARAATRRHPPVMWNCWRTGLTWEAPASETICM